MNRLPSSTMANKSPYELIYSKVPTLSHLKVIGCLCYASLLPKGDKFAERAIPTIFLGYSELQKVYILLDIKSRKFIVSRDVVFHESIFPFSAKYIDSVQDVYGSPLEVIDTPIPDYETDNATNTEVYPDENVAHPIMQYEDNTITLIETEVDEVPTTTNIPTHNQPVSKTSRKIKEYVWMKDYTENKQCSTRHPIANSLSYERVTPSCKVFLSKLSEYIEPKHFHQAIKDDRWIQSMQQEIKTLEDNNTWTIVELPKGMHTIGSKWIYKIKYKSSGEVERFKSK